MPRWVLLRHTLPDETSHHDWMLERSGHRDAGLLTFRLEDGVRPSDRGLRTFSAEHLTPHRCEYLVYEGPVLGDRGWVVRVESGLCEVIDSPLEGMTVVLYDRDSRVIANWRGKMLEPGVQDSMPDRWRFDLAD
ncbi:MAG: hypothetical protein KF869_03810 [Phycisphaeraceae bacterium]|nr:hypothetical protein [Phycisphaeraceae bacterium]